jgi:isoaspartyl peptidase/L-asparaginase-like protein (Ntn-hydrolase superfamily)
MTSQDRGPTFYVIAAHGGAGYHPPATDPSLKSGLRAAISSALTAFPGTGTTTTSGAASSDIISSESSALDAATIIIAALEDAPDFNVGYGSNLTYDGDVECDASLMLIEEDEKRHGTAAAATTLDSDPLSSSYSYSFGSVGAVRGVRNPVLVARRVLEGRRRRRKGTGKGTGTTIGLGRVPPLMVVGEGAAQFAREQGLPVIVDPDRLEEEMVAPRARREWREWREREREWREQQQQQQQQEGREEVLLTPRARSGGPAAGGCDDDNDNDVGPLHARQDTVGAVVLVGGVGDVRQRQIAAGVSRCAVLPVASVRPYCLHDDANMRAGFLFFFPFTEAAVCCSSTLDALARSVQSVNQPIDIPYFHMRHPEESILGCMRPDLLKSALFFFSRLGCLVPAAG